MRILSKCQLHFGAIIFLMHSNPSLKWQKIVFLIEAIAALRYNKVNVLQLKVCLYVFNSQSTGEFECL